MKYIIAGIIVVIILGIFGFIFFMIPKPDVKTTVKCDTIYANSVNDTLFVKLKTVGLNHVMVISQNSGSSFDPDSTKDFIYEGVRSLFYKLNNDTLLVYTVHKTSVPKYFHSKITIRQIELSSEDTTNFNDQYMKLGLKKME